MKSEQEISTYWDKTADEQLGKPLIFDNWMKRHYILSKMNVMLLQHRRVLELGCGNGVIAAALQILSGTFSYKAIDTSPKFVEWMKRAYRADATVAFSHDLPYQDREFDTLFAFDVMEHIHPDKRDKTYEEIDRVLDENAVMFIHNPLSTGTHDPEFDFGWYDYDLSKLCMATSSRIWVVDTYCARNTNRYSQMIILLRGDVPHDSLLYDMFNPVTTMLEPC